MIREKGEPAAARIPGSWEALQIPGDSTFGDREAKLEQFAMDLRRAPVRILSCHAADQSTNLIADSRPAATRPRSPAPVQTKARPMPPDHRLRLHNDQNIRPSRPHVPQTGPNEAVEADQQAARPLSFQPGDLLPTLRT